MGGYVFDINKDDDRLINGLDICRYVYINISPRVSVCLRAPPYLVVEEHAGEVDDGLVHRLVEDLAVDFWRDIERKEGKQRVYANAPPKRGPRHQPMVPPLPALHTYATTMHTYTRLDTHTHKQYADALTDRGEETFLGERSRR